MNKHLSLLLTAIACLAFSFHTIAQVQTAKYISMTSQSNAYYEYLPQGYSPSGSQKYPLLIFVHGSGEVGDGTPANLPAVLRNGTPKQISNGTFPVSFTVNGQTFKFIVLSPQFNVWPSSDQIDTIIDYAVQHYKVDTNRIYLTGLSMGGGVVWEYAGNNPVYAKRVAAIVPICGASWPDVGRADIIAAANIGVWATHNDNDPTCPVAYTVGYVTNIDAAPVPPNPLAKKTIFSSSSHDAWTATYDLNFRENGLNVYEWMLQFSRAGNIILPISGLSFNAEKKDAGNVLLSWKTDNEYNNKGFEIQRSADGKSFSSLSFINSRSLNGNGAAYSFLDASPLAGKNYYRLLQTDQNGNAKFSAVQEIDIDNGFVKLFPNPVKDLLNVSSDHVFNKSILRIYDMNGRLAKEFILSSNTAALPVKELAPGMYSAEIINAADKDHIRMNFIKQ